MTLEACMGKLALNHQDDATVKPEPGPAGFVDVSVASLRKLGLPSTCVGGKIVADELLEPGIRWCVYEHGGGRYGFAYEIGQKPFGNAKTVEITLMEAYDDGTYQQVAA